jgi:hypothetical protein
MRKFKKIVTRIVLVFIILIPVAAFAHFLVFPQETKSMLIGFSNFKKEGRVYFNTAAPQGKVDSLQSLIEQASIRVGNFWGEKKADSKFIYCAAEDDFKKYSVNPSAPAVTYLKLGSVIVLSSEAVDIDIIAHEMSHAELHERIGFFKFHYTIPSWFKHGLAMQNDYRDYYSADTLKARTDNFRNMPDIKNLTTDGQFYAGTREQVMLNYMTASYAVKKWHTKVKLDQLLRDLDAGKSFEKAFAQ